MPRAAAGGRQEPQRKAGFTLGHSKRGSWVCTKLPPPSVSSQPKHTHSRTNSSLPSLSLDTRLCPEGCVYPMESGWASRRGSEQREIEHGALPHLQLPFPFLLPDPEAPDRNCYPSSPKEQEPSGHSGWVKDPQESEAARNYTWN